MRFVQAAAVLGFLAAATVPVLAADIDAATLEKVRATATKGYANPGKAEVRNVRKSLATNGSGYCGEVTLEDTPDTVTTFHVLLETPTGPSVLRLSDFSAPDTDPQAAAVHQMMRNFGCLK